MSRILAIDYGSVRVGLAISDPLKIFSTPLKTIQNCSETSLINELQLVIESSDIELVLLGIPYNNEGNETTKTKEVLHFFSTLKANLTVPIELWDESFTTVDSNNLLKKKGKGVLESRKEVDAIAASFILKSYLDSLI